MKGYARLGEREEERKADSEMQRLDRHGHRDGGKNKRAEGLKPASRRLATAAGNRCSPMLDF